MRHCGAKSLVVKMDDKANCRFWKSFFYIQTEHVVSNPVGFPKTWNFAPERVPPPPVADIREWNLFSLVSRRGVRRTRAPALAFCQPAFSTQPVQKTHVGESTQRVVARQTMSAIGLVRLEVAPRSDIPVLAVRSTGEPSRNSSEGAPLKMRRLSEGASLVETSLRGDPTLANCSPSLANEKGKGVIVDDYESDSDIDHKDMRMFEEGFTRVDVREEGPSRVLEIPSDFNLLEDTVELVPQFDLLCSAAESESLREINDSALSRGVAEMALRIESARRAETRVEVFLKMDAKYRRYRDKCREMHAQLREDSNTQSVREELEKRDEELEVGKGVATECENLQAKVQSLRAELEQNATRVADLSVEWTEKVAELEKKVIELEISEGARVSALARAAALEDTIRVLMSEKESERTTATLREARLEERIGELDREATNLGDRVAVLETEKAQLLAQATPQESSSTTVPRRLYELWVHAEA
ncbi:COP1-interactive protein 1-like [Nicotiana sylvestris]|uniref:COP1-interactive protein 1-like n=1 Tax=Nicotiana sylvestris TaxID=4096 RepID=UPI00388CE395